MLKVNYSDQARADLKGIWFYIYENNAQAARRVIADLQKKCRMLSQFPEIGRKRDEIKGIEELYSFPFGNYIVFYQIAESEIRIYRILHGSMDIPSLFDFAE